MDCDLRTVLQAMQGGPSLTIFVHSLVPEARQAPWKGSREHFRRVRLFCGLSATSGH